MAPPYLVFASVLAALIQGSDAYRHEVRTSPLEPRTESTNVLAELQSHSKEKEMEVKKVAARADDVEPDHGMQNCHERNGPKRNEYGWMTFCQQSNGNKVKMGVWENPGSNLKGERWYDRGFEQAFWNCAGAGDARTGPYTGYCVDNCFQLESRQHDDGTNAVCRQFQTQKWCIGVRCTPGPGTTCEDRYLGNNGHHEAIEVKDYLAEKYGKLDLNNAGRKIREQIAWRQRQIEDNDRSRQDDEKICKAREDYPGVNWLVKNGCGYHWESTVADSSGKCPWDTQ